MVEGKRKSRSARRVKVRTPSGKVNIHYRPRKPNAAKCGTCGDVLKGVARALPSKKLTKSQKSPSRPYGGNLCSKCTRNVIKKEIVSSQ